MKHLWEAFRDAGALFAQETVDFVALSSSGFQDVVFPFIHDPSAQDGSLLLNVFRLFKRFGRRDSISLRGRKPCMTSALGSGDASPLVLFSAFGAEGACCEKCGVARGGKGRRFRCRGLPGFDGFARVAHGGASAGDHERAAGRSSQILLLDVRALASLLAYQS